MANADLELTSVEASPGFDKSITSASLANLVGSDAYSFSGRTNFVEVDTMTQHSG